MLAWHKLQQVKEATDSKLQSILVYALKGNLSLKTGLLLDLQDMHIYINQFQKGADNICFYFFLVRRMYDCKF